MNSLSKIELKAFVPARGFGRSKQFYQDVGFTLASDADGVAYFHHENTGFLLQTSTGRSTPKISRCICWSKTLMHGGRKSKKENLGKYGVKTLPPEQRRGECATSCWLTLRAFCGVSPKTQRLCTAARDARPDFPVLLARPVAAVRRSSAAFQDTALAHSSLTALAVAWSTTPRTACLLRTARLGVSRSPWFAAFAQRVAQQRA